MSVMARWRVGNTLFIRLIRVQLHLTEKGGRYSDLALAEDSFRVATTKRNIDNSWGQSKLVTKVVQSVLNEFDDTHINSSRRCEVGGVLSVRITNRLLISRGNPIHPYRKTIQLDTLPVDMNGVVDTY